MSKTISIFAAYKFISKYYKKDKLEDTIGKAIKNTEKILQKKFNGLKLEFIKQNEVTTGDYIGEFVKNCLTKAMINIFEISDKSPNVEFEVGFSLAVSRFKFTKTGGYDIYIQSNQLNARDAISDMLGQFITIYVNHSDEKKKYTSLRKQLESELHNKIINLLDDEKFLKSLVWKMQGESVNVVYPSIPLEDQKKFNLFPSLGGEGDFNTVYETSMFLSGTLNCKVSYFPFNTLTTKHDLYDNHIVVIGGPSYNGLAERLMAEYDLPFQYKWDRNQNNEDYLEDKISRKTYHSKKDKSKKEVIRDYGIFAVLPSNHKDGKTIILISGITTLGVLGASRVFAGSQSYENSKLIINNLGLESYFVVLVESEIHHNEVSYPLKIEKSRIISYNLNSGSWEKNNYRTIKKHL